MVIDSVNNPVPQIGTLIPENTIYIVLKQKFSIVKKSPNYGNHIILILLTSI